MNKTLFLVCPFNHSESLVRSLFREESYFLTAPAGIFNCQDTDYANAIASFLTNKEINHIIVVQRTECRFLRNALALKPESNLNAEKVLARLVQTHHLELSALKSLAEKQEKLARFNIDRQMHEIFEHDILRPTLLRRKIKLSGWLFLKRDFERIPFEPLMVQRSLV
jgi:carbonic anhydrase